mmetsp:Transcript_57449/g.136592  ORF Transcript_57449/g.136592 Transcript_57449/m.136592 type:complete len:259 (-) Transcript_57449:52-828(-)
MLAHSCSALSTLPSSERGSETPFRSSRQSYLDLKPKVSLVPKCLPKPLRTMRRPGECWPWRMLTSRAEPELARSTLIRPRAAPPPASSPGAQWKPPARLPQSLTICRLACHQPLQQMRWQQPAPVRASLVVGASQLSAPRMLRLASAACWGGWGAVLHQHPGGHLQHPGRHPQHPGRRPPLARHQLEATRSREAHPRATLRLSHPTVHKGSSRAQLPSRQSAKETRNAEAHPVRVLILRTQRRRDGHSRHGSLLARDR